MKILVVQLARFGDIYQSWPTLRALRRKYPGAEIHLLVRKRFAAALEGLGVDVHVHQLDTAHILETLFSTRTDVRAALSRLDECTNELRSHEFEQIVNLSFSPFSSYLAKTIAGVGTEIRGYTRFSDGFLSIPDDPSAYFYAQVGVGKLNRVHLTEIFASVAEVDLDDQDWLLLEYQRNPIHKDQMFQEHQIPLEKNYVVLHVGASDGRKTLDSESWAQICRKLLKWWQGQVILVGGPEEVDVAQRILEGIQSQRVFSLVGKTRLPELFPLLSSAKLVIGGDSVVMQMASLAQVECFNLSFPAVNFWETGPREPGSRVLVLPSVQQVNADSVAKEIWNMIEGLSPEESVALASGSSPVWYDFDNTSESEDFSWDLIRALYLGDDFPAPTSELVRQGFSRLYELAELAITQTEVINNEGSRAIAAEILGQVDSLLGGVRRMVPELEPLISWFETEKLRIGPGSFQELVDRTRKAFESLKLIAGLYSGHEAKTYQGLEEGDADNNLVS